MVRFCVRFFPPGWKPGATAGKMPAATVQADKFSGSAWLAAMSLELLFAKHFRAV